MRKVRVFLGLVLLMFFMNSCNKEENNAEEQGVVSNAVVNSVCKKQNTTMLNMGPTKYALLGDTTDVESLFDEFRNNPLSSVQVKVFDNLSPTQIQVNNILLSSQNSYFQNDFNSLYGSVVSYQIGTTNPTQWDMYIPKRIEIISPPILTVQELLPYCYYNDMTIKWNADVQNNNGIVVIVEWSGSMLYGQSAQQSNIIRNIDIISVDDGIEVLNNSLFQGIPEDAIATLSLVRGNYDIVNHQGDRVKIGGQSVASLPFVLVRDMSHYN